MTGFLDALCRQYQSLFARTYAEQANLVALQTAGRTDEFLGAYFAHEYRKGAGSLARFDALAADWCRGRVLDFGCGAGGLTCRAAERCREAVGLDLERYKLDYAAEQAARLGVNAGFVCYDGGGLPFEDDSFDAVLCVDVIEHLPTPERFVAEFRRVLRPGGRLMLSFGPPWGHAHGKHMWTKLPGWWTHLLFPRAAVMRVAGYAPDTTWEQLGMHRLTVGAFERVMRRSGLVCRHQKLMVNKMIAPVRFAPLLRELFVAEVVGVYEKPVGSNS